MFVTSPWDFDRLSVQVLLGRDVAQVGSVVYPLAERVCVLQLLHCELPEGVARLVDVGHPGEGQVEFPAPFLSAYGVLEHIPHVF